jgi:hypothetical protein
MVPWTDADPLIETMGRITPGSWAQLEEDFRRFPPQVIVDLNQARFQGKYPLYEQPMLWRLITREFAEIHVPEPGADTLRIYRRLDAVAPVAAALPALPADESVVLSLDFTTEMPALPKLLVQAPVGAQRYELYAEGRLFRSVTVPAGAGRIAIIVRPEEWPGERVTFVALVQYESGVRRSLPLTVTAADVAWRSTHAPGPKLSFLDHKLSPLGGATRDGPPQFQSDNPDKWAVSAPAWLVYERPAGMRSLRFRYGLSEEVYYDQQSKRASDGVDIVADYVNSAGQRSRLLYRKLRPKTDFADCGPQIAEIMFPDRMAGQFCVRVSPGPEADALYDWAYVGGFEATAYGPPLVSPHGTIPSEDVCAHGEPVMICDPNGRWIAHPPSTVTYEIPADARRLSFDFGLEPASYDGSQVGRSDGIEVVVTAAGNDAAGATTTVYHRTIDPATTPGDRGAQTAGIELDGMGPVRLTVVCGEFSKKADHGRWLGGKTENHRNEGIP